MTDKQININITLINDLVNTKNRFLKKVYISGKFIGWVQPALFFDENMNIVDNHDNRENLRMIGEDDYLDNRRPTNWR